MRYWWVNQNQTYKAEIAGGYIWSPKRNRNEARNQFYENMREVSPGDLVVSFRNTLVSDLGIAQSYCYDAPKPTEFGTSGDKWDENGWKVDIAYSRLTTPIRPKEHIELLRPHLPPKYSPLQQDGDGLQSVYLAELPAALANALLDLIVAAGNTLPDGQASTSLAALGAREAVFNQMDSQLETVIQQSTTIAETEKEQIIKARRGQGRFRANVQAFEKHCRVTGVSNPELLIASHIKPWRISNNQERLDGENGLLLTPTVDFLFDRGFISFADDGRLLLSPVMDADCYIRLGVPVDANRHYGTFSQKQCVYLKYHRRDIFLETGVDD